MSSREEPRDTGIEGRESEMQPWVAAELKYARALREAPAGERKRLYAEAYSAVAELRVREFKSDDPAHRTAGTYPALVDRLAALCPPDADVLEIAAGRGYTCLRLAPAVRSIVGLEVSDPSLQEARQLIASNGIENVQLLGYGAQEIEDHFGPASFDVAISIELIEHLHPDDAQDHFRQVFDALRPGGCYFIVTPNATNGPHDVTRDVDPASRQPLGFHLNETTYRELVRGLRTIGFGRFRTFFAFSRYQGVLTGPRLPVWCSVILERAHALGGPIARILDHFIGIKLIAEKPKRS